MANLRKIYYKNTGLLAIRTDCDVLRGWPTKEYMKWLESVVHAQKKHIDHINPCDCEKCKNFQSYGMGT